MCGLIGVYGKVEPSLVEQLLVESQIRGKHATGVSYIRNKKLVTIIEPFPAEYFVKMHSIASMAEDDGYFRLIGHCRYSTSDIKFNQPIYDESKALVHNGVITQEPPEKWAQLYGYDTKTTNDSELLFLSCKHDVLDIWKDSSIAAIYLDDTGNMVYFRNGKRPLYHVVEKEYTVITSTFDIYERAINNKYTISKMIDPYKYYLAGMNTILNSKGSGPDLQ